ncbi:MAG: enoyl-CoA hydratase-related protein [Acidimicrobiia bacterium]|nr:enoyl-CoA hydratase-related protein [Acidimicrobiia bacterium]
MGDSAPPAGPVILTEVTDRIGTVTLNRPERRNALDPALIEALDGAVNEMADRDDVKVVILTGAPAEGALGGFCSGGDTKEGISGGAGGPRTAPAQGPLEGDLSRHDRQAAMLLHTMPKPTIAMVGGPAIGAGCSLAAACDLRFASEDAVFAANFSAVGLSGDYGGSFFWTGIIGTARTRELYLLNEKLTARQAYDRGMVHRVLPAAELRDHVMSVAQRLLRTPASLLALLKDNLNQAEEDTARRRHLFANELANQGQAALDIMARMRRRAQRDA